jgi:hypothetical protein
MDSFIKIIEQKKEESFTTTIHTQQIELPEESTFDEGKECIHMWEFGGWENRMY